MNKNNSLTQEELKKVACYDPETGDFTRILYKGGRGKKGDLLGGGNGNGYLRTRINGKNYYLHRLAFLYMTGRWPKKIVDHINGNRSDNRWHNLRECSYSQNIANTNIWSHNTSGYRGVVWREMCKTWVAQIKYNKKTIYIGEWKTKEKAAEAYNKKAAELFGDFAYFNEITR